MAINYYLQGLFSLANVFIAAFILTYSYLFLKKTEKHKERIPWDFLFVSSIVFFAFQIFSMLAFFNLIAWQGINILLIGGISQFVYAGLVLLAFVSQHDLILKSHLILITKKEGDNSIKYNVEFKTNNKKKKTLKK